MHAPLSFPLGSVPLKVLQISIPVLLCSSFPIISVLFNFIFFSLSQQDDSFPGN